MSQRMCGGDAFIQGGKTAGIFERIAGCHQPPDTIKFESFEREQSRRKMRLVWRIESSAEQADPHAGRVRRNKALGDDGFFRIHGRVWPVPWMRYLKVVNWSTPTGPRACS